MKVKIISAIIALLIVVPLVLCGGYLYAGAVSIISVIAYTEILGLKKSHRKIPKVVSILGLVSLIYLVLGNYGMSIINYRMILLPLILMLLPVIFCQKEKYGTDTAFYLLGFIYLIGLGFNLMIVIRNLNLNILLYLMSVSIFTDTFAYAIGSLIGKHKMCPKISPLKSWEGAVAGLVGGSIIGLIVYINLVGKFSLKVLVVTIILSLVGQLGDLIFSKVKRENDIKDFSGLIPGHGGILDRFDNMIMIVITYVLLIWKI